MSRLMYVKFVFSKKAPKIDKIFTVDLTLSRGVFRTVELWVLTVIEFLKIAGAKGR